MFRSVLIAIEVSKKERAIYLRGQRCARVRKGLIEVCSPRGIKWYRF